MSLFIRDILLKIILNRCHITNSIVIFCQALYNEQDNEVRFLFVCQDFKALTSLLLCHSFSLSFSVFVSLKNLLNALFVFVVDVFGRSITATSISVVRVVTHTHPTHICAVKVTHRMILIISLEEKGNKIQKRKITPIKITCISFSCKIFRHSSIARKDAYQKRRKYYKIYEEPRIYLYLFFLALLR